MSINHCCTDLQETHWWQQQQLLQQSIMETTTATQNSISDSSSSSSSHKIPKLTTTPEQFSSWHNHSPHQFYHHQQHHQLWLNSDNYSNNNEQEPELGKEPMFEKLLTPSDVGKLNRLVIPKQHAEKYFPLGGGDSSKSDKGLLLTFEEESGKCWSFRYSYWNSSQSYVLTKGWSRYVKEKRLDAGDVILFHRHRTDSERLFIGWRRRGPTAAQDAPTAGGGGGWPRGLCLKHPYHGVIGQVAHIQRTPFGNSKTLRLFGVNLECQLDESATASELGQRSNCMEITFAEEDVNQMMSYRRG